MANKNIRGITIEIGGDTTKLGKAIEESEKKTKGLNGELKDVNNLLKFDPKNVELLAQKQTILTQNVEETSKKLDILREAERQVIAQFEKGEVAEEQVRALQREIIKTEGVLGSMKKELSKVGDETDDMSDSFDKAGESAGEANDGFTIMKGALAELTANAIQGAISAVGDFIGSLLELSEATEEYRIMQNKLSGSAGTFGYSVGFASEKYKEFYGYLADDQASTNAITNLMGLGTSTETLSKLTESAIAVWTAYGDSIPIESLTESINETAQVGKITGVLADALNWAGISEDEFNAKLEKTTSVQERADLIAQTLNDTYGKSKKKYDELSGGIIEANKAELALKDTQAELGKTVEPVNTALTNLKAQALDAILPVVIAVSNAFLDLLGWLKEHPVVAQILTAVVIALATAFGILATALAIQGLITGVTKAIAFLNTTILANPIMLLVTAIAGLVAGFLYLWENCEAFREFFINLWETIKNAVLVAVDAIVGFFTGLWETVSAGVTAFVETVSGIFTAVVEWFKTYIIDPLASFFGGLWDAISSGARALWDVIVSIFGPVVEWFTKLFTSIYDTLYGIISNIIAIVRGLWEIIVAIFSVVGQWFYDNVIKPVADFFTDLWDGISSGAKKLWDGIVGIFKTVAKWFSDTVIEPVKKVFTGLWDTLKGGASKAWEGIKSVFSSVASFFKNIFTTAWTAVKNVFSVGGKIFDGIKDGIVSAFKTVVNAIIKGINKVVSVPFDGINWALNKIRNIDILGIEPFKWIKTINVPQIPLLYRGGILKKGQTGFLEGNGTEAVVPLEKETGWINRIAQKMNDYQAVNPGNANLSAKMDEVIRTMKSLKSTIVLDTGVLVGETINQFDTALGNAYALKERRI